MAHFTAPRDFVFGKRECLLRFCKLNSGIRTSVRRWAFTLMLAMIRRRQMILNQRI